MSRWLRWMAVIVMVAGTALIAPAAADAAPYCGIRWGSLDKSADNTLTGPIVNVRAGQHPCHDRLVIDFDGGGKAYVRYVDAVLTQGRGSVLPLRGSAFLEIIVVSPTYDVNTGLPTYDPANPMELVDVAGWRTFRQVALGGSYEGYTTIGLGVRARLPFRAFTLAGPGGGSRLVIDVAHRW